MRKITSSLLGALVITGLPIVTVAEDIPLSGTLQSENDHSALSYDCRIVVPEKLTCDFSQISVWKNAKPEVLQQQIEEAPAVFDGVVKTMQKSNQCLEVQAMSQYLAGNASADDLFYQMKAPARTIGEFTKWLEQTKTVLAKDSGKRAVVDAIVLLCRNRHIEDYIKLLRAQDAIEKKTCTLFSNRFSQTFVHVGNAWVAESSPSGECGLIQLSRFEKDRYGRWAYYAKKATSNPSGKAIGGMTCSEFVDQREYPYTVLGSKDNFVGCDYVTYAP